MKTVDEIRLENLMLLIFEKGTQEAVAEAGGTSSVYLSQIKNRTPDKKTGKPRQMGDDMARKLEEGCVKERGWMDNVHALSKQYPESPTVVPLIAAEPKPAGQYQERFDIWTRAAIEILQKLDIGQRQAMVARMREYQQYLGPPRVGQAL